MLNVIGEVMAGVVLHKIDEEFVYVVFSDNKTEASIKKFFAKRTENFRYSKKYQNGQWDGYIRYIDYKNRMKYNLLFQLAKYCKVFNLTFRCKNFNPIYAGDKIWKVMKDRLNSIKLTNGENEPINYYDFQYSVIRDLFKFRKLCAEAVPSSGKSMIIYAFCRLILMAKNSKKNVLIIVPNIDLCGQLYNDFIGYDKTFNVKKYTDIINSTASRFSNKRIIISTWQSYQTRSLREVDVLICDEVHRAKKQNSKYFEIIKDFREQKPDAYLLALTGTIPQGHQHYFEFVGNIGCHMKYTTEKMMEELKLITKVVINTVLLNHTRDDRERYHHEVNREIEVGDIIKTKTKKYFNDLELNIPEYANKEFKIISINNSVAMTDAGKIPLSHFIDESKYLKELKWSISNENTLNTMFEMSEEEEGNVLILFYKVQNEGKIIHDYFANRGTKKKLFYVDGKTKNKGEILDEVRSMSGGSTTIANVSVLGTGISVKSLRHCMLATSVKSDEMIRQAIGRVARLFEGKDQSIFTDFVHNFTLKDGNKIMTNVSTISYESREKIYKERKYPVKIKKINFKENGYVN